MPETHDNGNILEITKADRYRTVNDLVEHSKENSSYYTLLLISTFIVASGLLLNNSAIVIGGMLVAPVLTPMLMVSLGLAVGEPRAVKKALYLIVKSFALVIAAAAILTILFGRPSGIYELENTMRSAMLYFMVALSAGVAGAFAWAKEEISEVLPGIAISVSLVPPLALVGIWLSAFSVPDVRFYLLIVLFNLLGIMIGSMVVFSLLKFSRMEKQVQKEAEKQAEK